MLIDEMNCRILSTLYVRANGEINCDDDRGEIVSLGWVHSSNEWTLDSVLKNDKYQQIRTSFSNGFTPWPDICTNCAFLKTDELFIDNLKTKKIYSIQIETSLKCELACLCCSRSKEIKRRPAPYNMDLKVFESLLRSCVESGFVVENIEYAGRGEPLKHPNFFEFVKLARLIMPKTKQILHTSGNFDYESSLKGQYLDKILVACDGLYQGSYEKYRINGNVSKVLKFMKDAKSSKQSNQTEVVWKYLLFEFNDSVKELIEAQKKALELNVDRLIFILTTSYCNSKRFTMKNVQEIPLISSITQISAIPILIQDNEEHNKLIRANQTALNKCINIGQPLGKHENVSEILFNKSLFLKTFGFIDRVYFSDKNYINITGWAMEKNGKCLT